MREHNYGATDLDQLVSSIAHDLRAPLVNIRGFSAELGLLLKELTPLFREVAPHLEVKERDRVIQVLDREAPEALDFINRSAQRMDRLVAAVLKLSRLGHRELRPEPVQPSALVADIVRSLAHQIELSQTTVLVGELPGLACDRSALEQILGNLLDNALKYLDPVRPGRLEVSGAVREGSVVLQVADNGQGIAVEDQAKVFEMFQRAGRREVAGEGMGLAYVKTLVRQMGGSIECRSELGVGSTFTVSLPREAPAAAAP